MTFEHTFLSFNMILLQPTYFSPIIQYVGLLKASKIIFENEDNFQKQTYRNRCYINTANGKHLLNVPIQHNKDVKQKTKAELDRFADTIENADYTTQSGALDSMVNSLMKPLIKNWLDNNLPRIVEEVVSREIKKIVPKS